MKSLFGFQVASPWKAVEQPNTLFDTPPKLAVLVAHAVPVPTWPENIIFTFGFAQLAARIANRASAKTLNRATGVILVILGVVILGFSLLE